MPSPTPASPRTAARLAEEEAAAGLSLPENLPLVRERKETAAKLKSTRKTLEELRAILEERKDAMPIRSRERLKEAAEKEKELKAEIATITASIEANTIGSKLRKLVTKNDAVDSVREMCASSSECVNSVGMDGQTALHKSAMYGNVETVGVLIAAGADVKLVDQRGWTALMYAASNGHVSTTQQLMDSGTPLDAVANETSRQVGMNALHLAAHYAHVDVCKLLLESKRMDVLREAGGKLAIDLIRARPKQDARAKAVIEYLGPLTDAALEKRKPQGNAHWKSLRRLSNAATAANAFQTPTPAKDANVDVRQPAGGGFSLASILSNKDGGLNPFAWLRSIGASFMGGVSRASTRRASRRSRTSGAALSVPSMPSVMRSAKAKKEQAVLERAIAHANELRAEEEVRA